jgi:hypothetical protein
MSRPTWSEKGKAFEHLANLLRARRTACHTYRGQAILMSSQVNLRGICNLSAPTRPTVITCVDRLIGLVVRTMPLNCRNHTIGSHHAAATALRCSDSIICAFFRVLERTRRHTSLHVHAERQTLLITFPSLTSHSHSMRCWACRTSGWLVMAPQAPHHSAEV